MLTVALSTVRTRLAAFAGTLAALALGVSVIAAMALVLAAASAGNPHQRTERFAAAPFVIQADPSLRVRDRSGSLDSVPLLAQPDVPAAAIALLPGAIEALREAAVEDKRPGWLRLAGGGAALHLRVIAGSLRGLGSQTIAVDSSWGRHVGDTMRLWRADGTPLSLRVVAVVAATLSGPSLIVDRRDAGQAMPDRAYVAAGSPAAAAALLAAARSQHARVVPVSGWTAAVSDRQAQQNRAGLELLLGIAVAYSAIGMASTFLMSVAGRRPELALLHKSGATRRQVTWFVTAESLVLTLTAIALAGTVSCLVLGGLHLALAREVGAVPVAVPWAPAGAVLAGCVLIAVLASALPAWCQFLPSRRPPAGVPG